ncbi:unnamed protein product [Plutella xylostella]|uniref:(diamondback moth) hypothetical protein n=1 Tax=Plutella xylostella TaxID=51655 RepID=A0A8S4F3F1_PLUXY|nr:unnamed protein product [Plutella xylostella]
MNKYSYYCTLYHMGIIAIVPIAFNACPIYNSYKAGAFRGFNLEGMDLELSIYFHYPGFNCMDYFYILTVTNVYFTFIGGASVILIDCFLAVIVFQIIGHIRILKYNMENLPRPKQEVIVQEPDDLVRNACLLASSLGNLLVVSVTFEIVSYSSEKLIDAVYGMPWEHMNVSNRKYFMLFLSRVQDPIRVTFMGVVAIGVKSMGAPDLQSKRLDFYRLKKKGKIKNMSLIATIRGWSAAQAGFRKETYKDLNYVKMMKKIMWPTGFWPGEALGEKVPLLVKWHKIQMTLQNIVGFIGQVNYIVVFFDQIPFLDAGQLYITASLTFTMMVFTKINKFSYFCTVYHMAMILIVPPAFNALPIYTSYKAGAFRSRSLEGIDVELAVYYHYPGFNCLDYFYILSFVNIYFTFIGCVASEKLIDAVYGMPWECMNVSNRKYLMLFLSRVQDPIRVTTMGVVSVGVQTMGRTSPGCFWAAPFTFSGWLPAEHLLRREFFGSSEGMTQPPPFSCEDFLFDGFLLRQPPQFRVRNAFNVAPIYASYKAGAFRGRNIDGIDVELAVYYHFPGFDCMDYFYLLTFINMCVDEISSFFGPILGLNYMFHLVNLCVLFLECIRCEHDDLLRNLCVLGVSLGNLLVQSITFEIVSAYSEKLIDAVYGMPWESMNVSNRKCLMLFLSRVQDPIRVTTMGVVPVGVQTMGSEHDALVRNLCVLGVSLGNLLVTSITIEIVSTHSEKLIDAVYGMPWESMNISNRKCLMLFLSRVQDPIRVTTMGVVPSEKLIDAVYGMPWESMNVSNRKYLMLFLNRVQDPIRVTTMGVVPVGVQTMGSSEKLINAVYGMPWESMNVSNRKCLMLFLNRVQDPIRVTTMGVVPVGVQTMGSVAKASQRPSGGLKTSDSWVAHLPDNSLSTRLLVFGPTNPR